MKKCQIKVWNLLWYLINCFFILFSTHNIPFFKFHWVFRLFFGLVYLLASLCLFSISFIVNSVVLRTRNPVLWLLIFPILPVFFGPWHTITYIGTMPQRRHSLLLQIVHSNLNCSSSQDRESHHRFFLLKSVVGQNDPALRPQVLEQHCHNNTNSLNFRRV